MGTEFYQIVYFPEEIFESRVVFNLDQADVVFGGEIFDKVIF